MRGRAYAAGAVLAVVVVGACSHSSGGGGNGAAENALPAGGAGVAHGALPPGRTSFGRADSAGTAPNGGAVNGSAAGQAQSAKSLPLVDGSYKIQVARMTVAVKGAANVAAKANEATTIAEQVGGEVDRDDRTSGPHASASMLLRVPPDTLTDTLTQLSQRLGHERYRSLSSTDVTQKVADVSSRVRSAQDSIARLRVLFQHATKIADIIQIESELNSREADLESLQAQQRALDRQTSMASITLSLVTAAKKAAPPKPANKHHDNAFIVGLKRGWDGFTAAAAWIARAVGTVLPFLVLLLILGIGLRWAWPRLAHRRGPQPSPAPSE